MYTAKGVGFRSASMVERMSELHEDLRATAASIAADADRLAAIEAEKETLQDDHPRMVELSIESQRLAQKLAVKTAAEVDLAEQSSGDDD